MQIQNCLNVQMENDLDLEKAMNMERQSEEIKRQQNILRTEARSVMQMEASSVDRLIKKRQKNDKPRYTNQKNSLCKRQRQLTVLQLWRAYSPQK